MDLWQLKNITELETPAALSDSLSWTAGGTGDDTILTGFAIDRARFSLDASLAISVDVIVAYDATLAAGKTLSLTFDLQTSIDGQNWTDYAIQPATVVATGPTGGGRVVGVSRLTRQDSNIASGYSVGVDLSGARRYVRLLLTPDLSNTGTDTAVISTVGVFGGFNPV